MHTEKHEREHTREIVTGRERDGREGDIDREIERESTRESTRESESECGRGREVRDRRRAI